MSEGAVGRERYNIIYNLFPVGEQSVLTAFRNLSPQENPDRAHAATNREMRILRKTNPYVFTSLKELKVGYTEENAKQMFLGVSIFHRALREEAKSQGGALPTFTEQFVKDYDEQTQSSADNNAEEAYYYRGLSSNEVVREFRRKNIVNFRNLESEFSRIVEGKFCTQPNWLPEKDYRYTGIIYVHSLFKAGFSHPKNFKDFFSP